MTPLPAPCLLCGLEPASPTSAAWKASPQPPAHQGLYSPLTKVQLCSTGGYSDPREEEDPGGKTSSNGPRGTARPERPRFQPVVRTPGNPAPARGLLGFSEGSRAPHTPRQGERGEDRKRSRAIKASREQGHPQ